MPPEVLAVISAICFAGSHVMAKRGLVSTSVTAGFLVTMASSWLVVAGAVVLDPPTSKPIVGVGVFAIGGLVAPGVSRAAALIGVERLGPSIAVPVQQGLRPLLAVLGAAIILSETIGPVRMLGVVAIMGGGWMLTRQPRSRQPHTLAVGRSLGFRAGIVFPVIAAVGYAVSDVIVKRALEVLPDPAFGAMVGIGTSLVVWLAAHLSASVRRRLRIGPSVGWFLLSGVLTGFAVLTLFHALHVGEVSVVAPIVATQPLAVFVLSTLLLRDLERLNRTTVLAGVIVVAGTVLVSG